MKTIKSKKASAYIWLYVMLSVFAMGLIYIMLDRAYIAIDNISGDNFTGTQYEATYQKLGSVWEWWLVLFLIGAMIFGIVSSMRRDQTAFL